MTDRGDRESAGSQAALPEGFRPRRPPMGRGCAGVAALGSLATALVGLALWLGCRLSGFTAFIVLGLGLVGLGLGGMALRRRRWARAIAFGFAALLLPPLYRAFTVRDTPTIALVTLPGATGPRVLSRLFPEPDGSLAAAALISALGGLNDPEAPRFAEILRGAYERMQPSAASLPTPAIPTYLGQESPAQFDTIVVTPPGHQRAALIFLHGFSGSFQVYCWEIAQAASAARLITLCPALDASGAWWTPRGNATLRLTLEHAKRLGADRVYLAGLSNGAAGASVLVHEHEAELSGLILLSGMRAEQPPDIPVLVVQGASDRMMPASYAREYAARGDNVRYVEVEGGHLVFFSKSAHVRRAVSDFLRELSP